MRFILATLLLLLPSSTVQAQNTGTDWYSETSDNGVTIRNSFPKGGPYPGRTEKHYNHSYLVFFTQVVNETGKPLELSLEFSADSVAIPNSPDTFMKLFLPADTMTLDKRAEFSYGITDLDSFNQSTRFQRKLNPGEDCLFYVVALFYQTKEAAWSQERGGNRGELVVEGRELYYRLLPQIDSLHCGTITFD